MDIRFDGKTAIVTGGASGIGFAIAQTLAQSGARVVVADLDGDAAARAADQIGHRASSAAVDVTDADAVATLVDRAVADTGALHLMVNNAGIAGGGAPTGAFPVDQWQRIIDVNLNGVFYGCRYAIPAIRDAGGGAVLNVASILGTVGAPTSPAYVAAKHGVIGLTKSAALGHAADKVRVNAICPGFIQTPLIDRHLDPARQKAIAGLHALGRMGTAQEVADLAVFLLSDRAAFITGSAHVVDGGYTAQ